MLGAIIGDVIGSVHGGAGTKIKDFPLFVEGTTLTDDSVLTVAVATCCTRIPMPTLDVGMEACFSNGPGAAFASLTTALAMAPPCGSAESGLHLRLSRRYSRGPNGAPK